jgi:hypothetical protein
MGGYDSIRHIAWNWQAFGGYCIVCKLSAVSVSGFLQLRWFKAGVNCFSKSLVLVRYLHFPLLLMSFDHMNYASAYFGDVNDVARCSFRFHELSYTREGTSATLETLYPVPQSSTLTPSTPRVAMASSQSTGKLEREKKLKSVLGQSRRLPTIVVLMPHSFRL